MNPIILLEHVRNKGWHYLIRLREAAGILSNLPLPDGDFDMPVQIFLTRKQTNAVKSLIKENPGKYRFLPSSHNFEFLPQGSSEFYPISFRIVRFRISDDSTEILITNLEKDSFPVDELKHLYRIA